MDIVTTTQANEMAPPDLDLRSIQGDALTPTQLVNRALRFANQPTAKNWFGLSGGFAVESPGASEYQMPEVATSAMRLQRALSAIARGVQTSEQLKEWRDAAASMRIIPDFVIEGRRSHTKLTWWVPREVLDVQPLATECDWIFFAEDLNARWATALMLLLDPDQRFPELRECGLGEACDRERFHFRKRKYCCPQHWPDRKADWRERQKAVRELAKQLQPRSVAHARKLVAAVKDQGLKCEELVQRALGKMKAEQRPSTGTRRSR
jgi:hypothetical protein